MSNVSAADVYLDGPFDKDGNNVPAEVLFRKGLTKYIVCYQPKKESLS